MRPQPSGAFLWHRRHLKQHQALGVDRSRPSQRPGLHVLTSAFLGHSASLSGLISSLMLEFSGCRKLSRRSYTGWCRPLALGVLSASPSQRLDRAGVPQMGLLPLLMARAALPTVSHTSPHSRAKLGHFLLSGACSRL